MYNYAVTVKILDVSTGRFSHSASDFMGGASHELFDEINTLVTAFMDGMSAQGGQVAQAGTESRASAAVVRPPADDPVPEGLRYEVVDGKSVTISDYTGSAASIAIPARIQGLRVTAIGDWACYECSSLRNVTFSRRTQVGSNAFPSTARLNYRD